MLNVKFCCFPSFCNGPIFPFISCCVCLFQRSVVLVVGLFRLNDLIHFLLFVDLFCL